MGYIFSHVDRTQRAYRLRLNRFWAALKRRALGDSAFHKWWKELVEGDPEAVYFQEEVRTLLLDAMKTFAPGAYRLIENDALRAVANRPA